MTPTLSPTEREILERIDQREADMIARVKAWSLINSGSHNHEGLTEMRAELRRAFAVLGGEISDAPLPTGEYVNAKGQKTAVDYEPSLLVRKRPEAGIQIVLTGHYDTVFPKQSHFQKPVMVDKDTLNGPGVADMKGGIIVMLTALEMLERSDHAERIGYTVLLSPDEEIGSPGSRALLADIGRRSHVGLTYEPALADGSLAGARKGSGNFALIVKGRAAHAGRDHHLGRNAIASLSRFVTEFDALNGQREGVTFNIAKIDGGGASNIVPEMAVGRFNVRMVETEDMQWIEGQLQALIAKVNAEDGIEAELTGGFTRPPKPMAPANAQVFDWVKTAGGLLGLDIRWAMSGGVCEGNNLWASGCPNVDTLGVRGGEIHSDREFVKLSSFTERAKLSTLILLKLASGEFDAHSVKALASENLAANHACSDKC